MATAPRVLWKGAISFGLVHIPVSLHTATTSSGVDFDWLDERTMDPVGYKRVNKKTGKEIDKEQIVKGIEYDDGQYVVLTDQEIKAAYSKSTQSIGESAAKPPVRQAAARKSAAKSRTSLEPASKSSAKRRAA